MLYWKHLRKIEHEWLDIGESSGLWHWSTTPPMRFRHWSRESIKTIQRTCVKSPRFRCTETPAFFSGNWIHPVWMHSKHCTECEGLCFSFGGTSESQQRVLRSILAIECSFIAPWGPIFSFLDSPTTTKKQDPILWIWKHHFNFATRRIEPAEIHKHGFISHLYFQHVLYINDLWVRFRVLVIL